MGYSSPTGKAGLVPVEWVMKLLFKKNGLRNFVGASLAGIEPVGLTRVKSDLRNHQAIAQPRKKRAADPGTPNTRPSSLKRYWQSASERQRYCQ